MFSAMIDPTAGPATRTRATVLAARRPDLRGSRVGLLANIKRNAEQFLDEVGALLRQRARRRGRGAAQEAVASPTRCPPDMLAELVADVRRRRRRRR